MNDKMFDYAIDCIKQLKHKRSKTLNMKAMMVIEESSEQKVGIGKVKKEVDDRIVNRLKTDPGSPTEVITHQPSRLETFIMKESNRHQREVV